MNRKELDEYLEEMRKFAEETTPEKALAFLQRAGIIDKNGKLAEQYGGDGERT